MNNFREVLNPAGIAPTRRTTELTVAISQLVASGRGIATTTREAAATSYMSEFLSVMKRVSFYTLTGVQALPG